MNGEYTKVVTSIETRLEIIEIAVKEVLRQLQQKHLFKEEKLEDLERRLRRVEAEKFQMLE